jgi:tRNA(Ile)-lysidine synthase
MHQLKTNLDTDKRYLVAVSFGPDSMALLHHLFHQGYQLAVAHVNYHKRQAADIEQSQLEQWCFANNISCFVLDVRDLKKGNFQAQAREVRYQFFKQVLNEEHCDVLLTAHHQDDHLETALFQIQRQSMHQYYGMKDESVYQEMKVYHPLLTYTKTQLLQYCQMHKVPYAVDASNASMIYTRNRLRQTVQAYSLKERGEKLRKIQVMNETMAKAKQVIEPTLHQSSVAIQDYQTWTPEAQWMYWYELSRRHNTFRPLTHNLLKTIDKTMRSKKPNHIIRWNANHKLFKSYDYMRLVHQDACKPIKQIVKDNQTKITHSLWTLDFKKMTHIKLSFPLTIRGPFKPDHYIVDGHKKRLSRLMIDWKVPLYLRSVWPVFVYKNKIVYIPRYRRKQQASANDWLIVNE